MRGVTLLFLRIWFVIVAASALLTAGEFDFYATLRAGRPGGADWQMGLGTDTAASQSTGSFFWSNSNRFWRNGGEAQEFEIGFRSATQTAYVTVWDSRDQAWTRTLTNSGAAVSSNATWTFPAANFFAQASTTGTPSSIQLSDLTLAPGVQVLSGSLPVSLGASQPPATTTPMNAPLVINAASNGGDWYIAGAVRFSGLTSTGGSARNSQLQFFLRAMGADTPEGATLFLTGAGLLLLGAIGRNRRKSVQ